MELCKRNANTSTEKLFQRTCYLFWIQFFLAFHHQLSFKLIVQGQTMLLSYDMFSIFVNRIQFHHHNVTKYYFFETSISKFIRKCCDNPFYLGQIMRKSMFSLYENVCLLCNLTHQNIRNQWRKKIVGGNGWL